MTGARCYGGLRYRYRAENHGAADGVDAVCRSRRCANGGVSSLYRPRRREPLLAGGIRRALHAYQVKEDEQRWGWAVVPRRRRTPVGRVFRQKTIPVKRTAKRWSFTLLASVAGPRQFRWDTASFKLPIGPYRDLAVGVAEGGAETVRPELPPESICRRAAVLSSSARSELGLPPMGPAYYCRPPMSPLSTCCAPICKTAARCALTMPCRCCVRGG